MSVAHPTKMQVTEKPWRRGRSPRDARSARANRTRTAIADALVSLIREGNTTPTATAVARRAGTGVRTVFDHFGDMEGLYVEIIRRTEPRVMSLLTAIDPRSDIDRRITELVAQRFAVYELIAPLRRAVRTSEHARSSEAVRAAARRLDYVLTRQVSDAFADELRGRPDRYGVLERIAVHTSFDVWDHFVRVQRLSISRAQRHMFVTVMREFSDLLV